MDDVAGEAVRGEQEFSSAAGKDVREVAREAFKTFEKCEGRFSSIDYAMLRGFFIGVAEGCITVGQGWLVELLRLESNVPIFADKKDIAVIERIFASGMACENQVLSNEQNRSFADRAK